MTDQTRETSATVLVAYASEHGSTREIAERIAARLERAGLRPKIAPVDEVADIARFGAVVVGSAIHNRAVLASAAAFLDRSAGDLARRPLWLFAVGLSGALAPGLRARAEKMQLRMCFARWRAQLAPRGERLFSGVLRRADFPMIGRLIIRALGLRPGDYRDWDAIDAWADEIVQALALSDR